MNTRISDRHRMILFFVSVLLFVILGASGGVLNIAWTYMKDTFEVEDSAIGILLFFATTGSLIAAMGSGTLIRRIGLGRATLVAMAVIGIGNFAIAAAPVWVLLLVVMFVTYLGRGLLDSAMNNFVSDNYGVTAMNLLHASWGIGLTIAPAIMTFILINRELPWQAGYVTMAGLAALMVVLILVTFMRWDGAGAQDTDSSDDPLKNVIPATVLETLREPVVLLNLLVFFVYGGIEIGTGQLANTLFVDGRGMMQDQAAAWLSFYWGSFTVGRIALGWLALRLQARYLLRGGMGLALIGAILLLWNAVPEMSLTGLVMIGMGLAGIFPTLTSLTPARVGRRFSTQAIGFQIGVAGLGASIIPGTIGVATEFMGYEAISAGILLTACALILLSEVAMKASATRAGKVRLS